MSRDITGKASRGADTDWNRLCPFDHVAPPAPGDIEWNWLGATGQLHARDGVVHNIGSLLDPSTTGLAVPE